MPAPANGCQGAPCPEIDDHVPDGHRDDHDHIGRAARGPTPILSSIVPPIHTSIHPPHQSRQRANTIIHKHGLQQGINTYRHKPDPPAWPNELPPDYLKYTHHDKIQAEISNIIPRQGTHATKTRNRIHNKEPRDIATKQAPRDMPTKLPRDYPK